MVTYRRVGSPWIDILQRPEVVERYQKLAKPGKSSQPQSSAAQKKKEERLYQTAILEQGKVAYLKISKFSSQSVTTDYQPIYVFLKTVKDYPILILDIRGNGGGAQQYWMENLVAPLTEKTLTASFRGFLRGGSFYEPFLRSRNPKLSPVKVIDVYQGR